MDPDANDLIIAANAAIYAQKASEEAPAAAISKPADPSAILPVPTTTAATEATEANIDAAIANPERQGQGTGYESSDIELSSDDDAKDDDGDSDSSSSSSESGDDGTEMQERDAKTSMALDDDDDEEGSGKVEEMKTVNEITDVFIERPVFEMTSDTTALAIGEIFQVIDKVIVVKSRKDTKAVDMGTLFVYEDREIMGEVFETFGPVAEPFYSVRYNSRSEIDSTRAQLGAAVLYVPAYRNTRLVETDKIQRIKGTDASNRFDEEVNESELEFSDDEDEKWHKRQKKDDRKRKRPTDPRGGHSTQASGANNASQRSFQNYADLEYAMYEPSPRARPPQPQESSQPWWAPSTSSQIYQVPPPQPPQPQQKEIPSTAPLVNGPEATPATPTTSYQTPAQLVSTLFGLSGPLRSVRSLFSTPPPPSSEQDE